MKYYYKKPENWVGAGEFYSCDHPMYNQCTLFRIGNKGLAVVQERFNRIKKTRWWSSIEPWIAGDIRLHKNFQKIFDEYAREADENGLYPTIRLRSLMWSLRMKPLKKEDWEIWMDESTYLFNASLSSSSE